MPPTRPTTGIGPCFQGPGGFVLTGPVGLREEGGMGLRFGWVGDMSWVGGEGPKVPDHGRRPAGGCPRLGAVHAPSPLGVACPAGGPHDGPAGMSSCDS